MSGNAIEVVGLVKHFGKVKAVDGLNLSVETGQVTGFLGPNGAGKTTTIRVLLGLLKANAGQASVLGGNPWTDAVSLHKRLVYVPGDVALWPNLTGGQIIDVLARLSGGITKERKQEMLERFQLDPTKKARTYSKGNRQKVALVAAMASRAELLVLDEPTSGLDPLMEGEFQKCIKQVKAEGRSVLLSSHIFSEVESLADSICIIRDGKTIEQGTLASMRHLTRTQVRTDLESGAEKLRDLAGIHDLAVDGQHVSFSVEQADLPTVLNALAELHPLALSANPPSLEEIFLSHYHTDVAKSQGVQK
ncbi:MAG: ABC transporter ATP-binding protein [Propionibacteriaceae bacterium]|nr:ABC transporter ATP-binding protein [Propionibacteriaceae bacterium]